MSVRNLKKWIISKTIKLTAKQTSYPTDGAESLEAFAELGALSVCAA